ncbi:response regulator transcription factor [Paraburkholderia sp. BL25I1N1]|uniref:response regulator transcription factor n=1 Tax=Paraburkholderia sp. BL25I1N1 TaxID=1938804 RepID=UPI000D04B609|nr:response regulator [Paraburkholderia sp. BL25I1N1]PRY00196.1 LuxR family two component transcriptional regulator [Paraburkholderia sp. BL25I1N1]
MKHDNAAAGRESLPDSLVYVVDDDESIRGALTSLLMSVGIHARAFESADDFLAADMPDVPSCLILDVRLRGTSGLTLQQDPFKESIRFPVIFLTGHGDIEMSVKAMKAGAFDFMTKPFRDQDLIDTIAAALKRDGELKRQERIVAGIRQTYDSLTAREREVIRLVADGLLNKQIADLLCLSEVTVKIHRAQAMHKLQARSVPDVVRKLQQVLPLH